MKYHGLRNQLGPPELLSGPIKPFSVLFSHPSYRKGVSIINNITSKIPKCHEFQKNIYESHLETPELHLGPRIFPGDFFQSNIYVCTLYFPNFRRSSNTSGVTIVTMCGFKYPTQTNIKAVQQSQKPTQGHVRREHRVLQSLSIRGR